MEKLKTDFIEIWKAMKSEIMGAFGTILTIDIFMIVFGLGESIYQPIDMFQAGLGLILWAGFLIYLIICVKGVSKLSAFLFSAVTYAVLTLIVEGTDYLLSLLY